MLTRAALGLFLLLPACASKQGADTRPPPPELEAVYYYPDATKLAFEDRPAVDQAAAELTGNPALHLLLIGRTDSRGTANANLQLGLQRAHEFREVLLRRAQGKIDASRVHVGSRGQAEPTASNDSEDGRATNRRVEFYFYYPDGTSLRSRFASPFIVDGE